MSFCSNHKYVFLSGDFITPLHLNLEIIERQIVF